MVMILSIFLYLTDSFYLLWPTNKSFLLDIYQSKVGELFFFGHIKNVGYRVTDKTSTVIFLFL